MLHGGSFFKKRPPWPPEAPCTWGIEPDTGLNKFLTVMTDQSGAAACCPPEAIIKNAFSRNQALKYTYEPGPDNRLYHAFSMGRSSFRIEYYVGLIDR